MFPSALRAGLHEAEARGESVIVLMDDRAVLARQLKTLGVQPVMITGDAEAVARTVADELNLERFHARVLPQGQSGPRSEAQQGETHGLCG